MLRPFCRKSETSLKTEDNPEEQKKNKHWILWTLVAVFVIASIAVMFAVDNFYAGDSGATPQPAGTAEN
jgi:flagellar basal body-associated protein FliL